MEIDIRNNSEEVVDVIRFSEVDIVKDTESNIVTLVCEDTNRSVDICKEDIDNLILAPQKVKEL